MFKRKRILLLASSVILLCAALIAGATFALFTEEATVETHLQAGHLEATLTRNSYKYTVLRDDGTLEEISGTSNDDFTLSTTEDKNFFGDIGSQLIVPGSFFEATFTIGNAGTTAFNYDVIVKLTGATEEADIALANQLYVKVGYVDANGNKSEPISKGFMNDGTYTIAGGAADRVLVVDATGTPDSSKKMYVTVEFIDTESANGSLFGTEVVDNNDAEHGAIKFDLFVKATQDTPVVTP